VPGLVSIPIGLVTVPGTNTRSARLVYSTANFLRKPQIHLKTANHEFRFRPPSSVMHDGHADRNFTSVRNQNRISFSPQASIKSNRANHRQNASYLSAVRTTHQHVCFSRYVLKVCFSLRKARGDPTHRSSQFQFAMPEIPPAKHFLWHPKWSLILRGTSHYTSKVGTARRAHRSPSAMSMTSWGESCRIWRLRSTLSVHQVAIPSGRQRSHSIRMVNL